MAVPPLVSVVVTNHNYGRFVGEAIDSALTQSYPNVEVVLVDDGSTDESRAVIERYGDGVRAIYQEQAGQMRAATTGFLASRGDVVLFLDADDVLLPSAASVAARVADDPRIAKVHWPLQWIRADGSYLDEPPAPHDLPHGDLRESLLVDGPGAVLSPQTSGNAWARWFLDRVLPAPPSRSIIDGYLAALAPLYGRVGADPEAHTLYRLHPDAKHVVKGWRARLSRYLEDTEASFEAVARHGRALGFDVDTGKWRDMSYLHRLSRSVDELSAVLPADDPFVLVDEADWDIDELDGRPAVPFPERDGVWWGLPADDADAVAALDRVSRAGIRTVVIGWPAFWWLDEYCLFAESLRQRFEIAHQNDRLMVFRAR